MILRGAHKALDQLIRHAIATDGTTSPEARDGDSTAFFALVVASGQRVRQSRPQLGGMALIQAIGDDMAEHIAPGGRPDDVLRFVCREAFRCQVVTQKPELPDDGEL